MNLAVPGHRVIDALEKRPDFPIDSMTDLVLGLPGLLSGISRSQVEWAEALQPTTIIVRIGNNDALNAAIAGDPVALTPIAEFEAAYSNLVKRLAATGATVFVANIPDVSVIPYVVPVPTAAALFSVPLPAFTAALGVSTTDYINLDNLSTAAAILQGGMAGPLTDAEFLDAGEIQQIRDATRSFNQIIATQAAANGAVLVDANAFLNHLDRRGIVVGGHRLTTEFLGGIFSLDGIHPSNTGAAATANYFIKTMNRRAAAHIPPVNVRSIERNDPLVFPRRTPPIGPGGK
jgi:lysophospholipase L1-like esterase